MLDGYKFDLVVGNPPYYNDDTPVDDLQYRLSIDKDWNIHKEFFDNITKYLMPGADLLLSLPQFEPFLVGYAAKNKIKLKNYYFSPGVAAIGGDPVKSVIKHYVYK